MAIPYYQSSISFEEIANDLDMPLQNVSLNNESIRARIDPQVSFDQNTEIAVRFLSNSMGATMPRVHPWSFGNHSSLDRYANTTDVWYAGIWVNIIDEGCYVQMNEDGKAANGYFVVATHAAQNLGDMAVSSCVCVHAPIGSMGRRIKFEGKVYPHGGSRLIDYSKSECWTWSLGFFQGEQDLCWAQDFITGSNDTSYFDMSTKPDAALKYPWVTTSVMAVCKSAAPDQWNGYTSCSNIICKEAV